jgi:hypothetical protein
MAQSRLQSKGTVKKSLTNDKTTLSVRRTTLEPLQSYATLSFGQTLRFPDKVVTWEDAKARILSGRR